MEKKVKMRSGGILIVVAIVQVLGNLFAFDANPTWKSCLPDSRLRHRGTGKWKARLLYLARSIAVLFACGVSTSVIPNCYHRYAELCCSLSRNSRLIVTNHHVKRVTRSSSFEQFKHPSFHRAMLPRVPSFNLQNHGDMYNGTATYLV